LNLNEKKKFVERLMEYLRAARMPALQHFINLEKGDMKLVLMTSSIKYFSYMFKKKHFIWIIGGWGISQCLQCQWV